MKPITKNTLLAKLSIRSNKRKRNSSNSSRAVKVLLYVKKFLLFLFLFNKFRVNLRYSKLRSTC